MNVLLLPGSPAGEAVAERLITWSGMDLLEPFCLWSPAEPTLRRLRRVRDGEQTSLPFAEALGESPPREVEFVAFFPLLEALASADARTFAEAVAALVAVAGSEVFDYDADRPLACTMVVAPDTVARALPAELFRPDWSNLMVAPEDRKEPGALNGLVGADDAFVAHAAHAAATLAELWTTPAPLRVGLLERLRTEQNGPLRVGVRVVRCYSRLIELGYLADHVAAWALATGDDGWPRPDAERFDRPRDPVPIVATLAHAYFDAHRTTLDHRPFERIEEPPGEEVSLREGWRRFLDSVRARWRQRQMDLADEALALVHKATADYLMRISDGTFRIRPWRELDETERSLDELRKHVAGSLHVSEGPVRATWTDLRQLTLGVLDGSRLPSAVDTRVLEREGRRFVICDPRLLAHDPLLGRDATATTESVPVADEHGEAHDGATPPPGVEPLLEQIRALAADALVRRRRRVETLRERLRAFETPGIEPSGESPSQHYARSVSALLRIVAVYTVAGVAGGLTAGSLLPPLWAILAVLTLIGLWIYLTASAASRTLLRPRIADDARASHQLDHLNLTLELAQAEGDVRRLERRERELECWIEILAELVHRPWTRAPFGALTLRAPAEPATLPLACAVAVAPPDRRVLEVLGSRARAYAFRPGWLTDIYDRVERRSMNGYVVARGGSLLAPDPAEDTSEDPDAPRETLRSAVLRGDGRHLRDNPLVDRLRASIDRAHLDEVAPCVVPGETGVRPLDPTTTWIAAPEQTSEAAAANTARMVRLVPLAANGVLIDARTVLTAAAAIDARGVRRVRVKLRSGDVAAPSDVLRLHEFGLALLSFEDELVPGLSLPQTGDVEPGQGVVTLDAPEGRPVSHWGFVAHRHEVLGIAYDGGPPLLGAAVFDLEGRLVAIHGPEGAHPVGDLEALRELIADAPDPEPERAPPVRTRTDDADCASPIAFLDAIACPDRPRLLTPVLWPPLSDANTVELCLPPRSSLGATARVDELSDGTAFMRPLHVLVHRVEATLPVPPHGLAAICGDPPA